MNKLTGILIDALILILVALVLVILIKVAKTSLEKKVPKDDPVVTAIVQGKIKNVESVIKEAEDHKTEGVKPLERSDDQGRTALMLTAYANLSSADAVAEIDEKRSPMVALLMEHGAPINQQDKDGWTALMWASWSGLDKTADKLLELGANPSLADRQGNTALTIAAQRGNVAIVRSLLSKGANLSAATKTGKTALDAARKGLSEYPDKKNAYQDIIGLLGSK